MLNKTLLAVRTKQRYGHCKNMLLSLAQYNYAYVKWYKKEKMVDNTRQGHMGESARALCCFRFLVL